MTSNDVILLISEFSHRPGLTSVVIDLISHESFKSNSSDVSRLCWSKNGKCKPALIFSSNL